jgi:MFS family permease
LIEPEAGWRAAHRKDALTAIFAGAYVGVLGPFLGLVAVKTLHVPVFLLSLMMAAPFVGNMLTPLWVHRMHGRPKLPFVVFPGLAARGLYLLMSVVQSAREYVLVVFLAQALEASSAPAYSAIMERIYPVERRGRLMGSVRVLRTLVGLVCAAAAGHALDRWGYHPLFVAAAVCGICSSLTFGIIDVPTEADRIERSQEQASPGAAWQIFLTDHAYRRFAISIFFYGLGNLLLGPIYPIFAAHDLGLSYAQQGLLSFVGMGAAAMAFATWGHYIDRLGPLRCVYACIAVVALKPWIYYEARSYLWLIPTAILDGVSNAGIEVGYVNSILLFSPPARVPAYQSLHALLLGIRGVIAPFLAGALVTLLHFYHGGVRPAFLVSAGLILFGWWLGRSVLAAADAPSTVTVGQS